MPETIPTKKESTIKAQTFVLTQDTTAVLKNLLPELKNREKEVEPLANTYFEEVEKILQSVFQEIVSYKEQEIEKKLKEQLNNYIGDEKYLIVCLDRFLLSDLEDKNFTRFQITRPVDGDEKIERIGTKEIKQQVQDIKDTANNRKIILVDDGSFSGGTFNCVRALFEQNGMVVEKNISFLGKNSDEQNMVSQNFPDNFTDWVDIRDFSPFGGKITSPVPGERPSTIPYILPFSDGSSASLDFLSQERLITVSNRLLATFQKMIREIETVIEKEITIQDLIDKNFGVPLAKLYPENEFDKPQALYGQSNPLPEMNLTDYINNCILANLGFKSYQEWQDLKVIITDVDGTLWTKGEQSFSDSPLGQAVKNAYIKLIQEQEKKSEAQAEIIYKLAVAEENKAGGTPVSQLFAEKYNLTREEIFNLTWGQVDMQQIIPEEEKDLAKKTLTELHKQGKSIIALTAAPKVWFEKVCSYLGLNNQVFNKIYTAEDFTTDKGEVMQQILSELGLQPNQAISIGDQPKSDIQPAKDLGIPTLQVTGPADLVFPSV